MRPHFVSLFRWGLRIVMVLILLSVIYRAWAIVLLLVFVGSAMFTTFITASGVGPGTPFYSRHERLVTAVLAGISLSLASEVASMVLAGTLTGLPNPENMTFAMIISLYLFISMNFIALGMIFQAGRAKAVNSAQ